MAKRLSRILTIGIFGEITYESLERFVYGTHDYAGWNQIVGEFKIGDKVEVLINSGGGDLDAGIGIYEVLKTSGLKFTTRALGLVGSTAALIFQAGTSREMTEGGYIFMHEGSVDASGGIKTLKSYSEHSQNLHQWYCRQIADRSGVSLQTIMKLAAAETFVNAEASLEMGLTDFVQPYDVKAK